MLTFADPRDQSVYDECAASMQKVSSLNEIQEQHFLVIFERQNLEALVSELGSYTYGSNRKITDLFDLPSISLIECYNTQVFSGSLRHCKYTLYTALPKYEYHPNSFPITEEDFNIFMKGD